MLYFTAADDNQASNLANWFQDAAGTIPATALPTASNDVVFLEDADNSATDPYLIDPTFFCRNLTASGVTLSNFYSDLEDENGLRSKIVSAGVVTLSNCDLYNVQVQAVSIVTTNGTSATGIILDSIAYATYLIATSSISLTDFVDSNSVYIASPNVQLFGSGGFYNIEGNVTFNDNTQLLGVVENGNATFNDSSSNSNNGRVRGDATFNDSSNNFGIVEGTLTCNTTGVCGGVGPTSTPTPTASATPTPTASATPTAASANPAPPSNLSLSFGVCDGQWSASWTASPTAGVSYLLTRNGTTAYSGAGTSASGSGGNDAVTWRLVAVLSGTQSTAVTVSTNVGNGITCCGDC